MEAQRPALESRPITDRSDAPRVLVVDVQDVWVRMPFQALSRLVPTTCLQPRLGEPGWPLELLGPRPIPRDADGTLHPNLTPRAFGRLARLLAPINARAIARGAPGADTIVFTRPSQRALAAQFPRAHRIYYVADDFRHEYGWPAALVESWERELLDSVDQVVCVSTALARSFEERYRWPSDRTAISPNAVPADLVPAECPARAAPLPEELTLPGPVAGVLGSISDRIRLDWIRQLVEVTPWLSWLLVGPTHDLGDAGRADLEWLRQHPRCRVSGAREYRDFLALYRTLDVAVIPYAAGGQNRACSPTRLFAHLPHGHPILATRSAEQLEEFTPLVQIADSVEEMAGSLEALRASGFDDGRREARWRASRSHTWEARAEALRGLLSPETLRR